MSNWPEVVESMPTTIDAQDFLSKSGIQHHTMHMQSHRLINSLQQVVGTGWGDPTASEFKTVRDRILAVETVIPVGTIVTFAGATAPSGWQLCDGSTHTSEALKLLLNQAAGKTDTDSYGTKTPDLRARFVVGASNTGSSLATGLSVRTVTSVGGEESVGLDITKIPSHTHPITVDEATVSHTHTVTGTAADVGNHTHWIDPVGDHSHGLVVQTNTTTGGSGRRVTGGSGTFGDATALSGGHSHGMQGAGGHGHSVSGSTNSVSSTTHLHTATAGSVGIGTSPTHNNMPPFYVLSYIIRL